MGGSYHSFVVSSVQMTMTFLLLTGAGFSRNWGGWLASEAFEYLLGCSEIDYSLRQLLWDSKKQGGNFEDALAQLQRHAPTEKPLQVLQGAILRMFESMNKGFTKVEFEPRHTKLSLTTDPNYLVRRFLYRFNVIFTLNQDLLLERKYRDENISEPLRWTGWHIPGMKLNTEHRSSDPVCRKVAKQAPDTANFKVQPGIQPYFKLHGSTNWFSGDGGQEPLLIMGGNKSIEIEQHPVLTWYHEKFKKYLSCPGARLMVIGYSFSDPHINEAIMQAADKGGLRLFIIDPQGVDVLSKVPEPLMTSLNPCIIGASRRPLTETFGCDCVEHDKIMRFFSE